MTEAPLVGRSVTRREDERLATGHGRFVADLVDAATLHAAFVRSTQAAAVIGPVDLSKAKQHPGVVAAFTHDDFAGQLGTIASLHVPHPAFAEVFAFESADLEVNCLARDRVHYVGEPIAVVIAESRAVAEDAVELVHVEYQPLPAVTKATAALHPGAPVVHDQLGHNLAASLSTSFGDIDGAAERAAYSVRLSLEVGRHGGMPLETRGVVADWDQSRGRVDVWTSSQVPHMVATAIRRATGWKNAEVRVAVPDVGGGFGPKANVYPEEVLLPWVSRRLRRRVAWIEDRAEHFQATAQGRDQLLDANLHLDDAGRILGWDVDFIADVGAGSLWVAGIIANTALHLLGAYRVPAYRVRGRAVFTNKTIVAQYRGAGRPEACFALERALDRAADVLGISPLEIRRRNILEQADLPLSVPLCYRDGEPIEYDGTDFALCLEHAAKHVSDEILAEVAQAHPDLHVGRGVATYVEATGRGPFEGAVVQLHADGTFEVSAGSASAGQGHETTFAQVAADALGVGMDAVLVRNGDTDKVAFGIGTFASRSAVVGGSAVHTACRELVDRARELIARRHGAEIDEVRHKPNGFLLRDGEIPWADLAAELSPGGVLSHAAPLRVATSWAPRTVTWTMGAHAAIVGVHPATGHVRVLDYAVAHEGGVEINPAVVVGQVRGGMAQGLGGALLETFEYGEDGQPQTASFAQYLLPSSMEVPSAHVAHLPGRADLNPIQVKGVGESGTIPVYAVLAAAIEDALNAPRGSLVRTPFRPEDVLELADGGAS
ncbi:xanthine dehydrogenase family protein molybdopterin-binding subunit [Saccharopolyspora shandongensis]|uniref:xanthine dehydrogenase family protein molybdopterin-binding subunit n=1 Tax=Saccharopolyspora shandongensis TaxID=418495 RepID=UPI0033E0DB14